VVRCQVLIDVDAGGTAVVVTGIRSRRSKVRHDVRFGLRNPPRKGRLSLLEPRVVQRDLRVSGALIYEPIVGGIRTTDRFSYTQILDEHDAS